MEKIKTAMQDFIDYLELVYGTIDPNIKEMYLEQEKNQLAKAFDEGERNDFYTSGWIINGKAYYDKKYNNE